MYLLRAGSLVAVAVTKGLLELCLQFPYVLLMTLY